MNQTLTPSGVGRGKRLLGTVATFAALLLSAGCGIPKLQPAQEGPTLPGTFPEAFKPVEGTETSSQVGIEEFFNDPTLTALINEAMAGNQELKILEQNIAIANNEVLARRGAYLPFINVGAGAGLERPSRYTRDGAIDAQLDILPGQPIPNPLPNFLMAADFSWQIDIWRQLRNARDAAAFRYLGSAEGRNYVVTRLVAEIAEKYYTLMALDKRLENLDFTIDLQEQSLEMSQKKKDAGRGTELAVQRFLAEVRRNQSEKLIVYQDIVVAENRINFLVGRYPEAIERTSAKFLELELHALNLGAPSDLLLNRPDVRQAERDLEAAGLDIRVARARFYPQVFIRAGVGYAAFDPRYILNTPEAIIANVVGDVVAPLINKKAIRADYLSANAKQLQAVYNYQRVILNAFTEVINRMAMVENYRKSIEIKKQQLAALEASVDAATKLFQNARAEYIDVLLAQRDLRDARMVLIDTKKEQLTAVINTYQALGGGNLLAGPLPAPGRPPGQSH